MSFTHHTDTTIVRCASVLRTQVVDRTQQSERGMKSVIHIGELSVSYVGFRCSGSDPCLMIHWGPEDEDHHPHAITHTAMKDGP